MKFILLLFLAAGCSSTNIIQNGYRYTIQKRIGGSESQSQFISCDSFVVQFILRKNVNNTVFLNRDSLTTREHYDTIGAEFIALPTKDLYFIDRFDEEFNLLTVGKYPDQSKGIKTSEYTDFVKKEDITKDTAIAADTYNIGPFNIKDSQGRNDSITGVTYWKTPLKGFYSVFSFKEIPATNLMPCGFRIAMNDNKDVFELRVANIEKLKPSDIAKYLRIFEKIKAKAKTK